MRLRFAPIACLEAPAGANRFFPAPARHRAAVMVLDFRSRTRYFRLGAGRAQSGRGGRRGWSSDEDAHGVHRGTRRDGDDVGCGIGRPATQPGSRAAGGVSVRGTGFVIPDITQEWRSGTTSSSPASDPLCNVASENFFLPREIRAVPDPDAERGGLRRGIVGMYPQRAQAPRRENAACLHRPGRTGSATEPGRTVSWLSTR